MLTGMKAPNAVRHSCKKRPPEHIKANIRGQAHRTISPSVLDTSVKKTYRVVSHGIGGAATHRTRVVIVAVAIVVDITEVGRRPGI